MARVLLTGSSGGVGRAILDDPALLRITEDDAELGAFVHVDDVAAAVLRALSVEMTGHVRVTLCGPGRFDTTAAREVLGWEPSRGWLRS